MANNKAASPRRQSETLRLSGIALAPKDGGPVEMENFRVTQSGAVEKRWGYTPTLALPGKPRACYAGYVQGRSERCFLIGDEVYRLTPDRFPGYLSVYRGRENRIPWYHLNLSQSHESDLFKYKIL